MSPVSSSNNRPRNKQWAGPRCLVVSLFFILTSIFLFCAEPVRAASSSDSPEGKQVADNAHTVSLPDIEFGDIPRYTPVYRIPLRVHLDKSDRAPWDFTDIFKEINHIWLSQAGICFEIEVVMRDEIADQGMDIWFMPVIGNIDSLNGYYDGDHAIWVRDTPVLNPAAYSAQYPAARTAAHEFGHGLGLVHRQNSDNNLMRSKTFGWRMNEQEVLTARRAAAKKSLPDTGAAQCGHAVFRPPSEGGPHVGRFLLQPAVKNTQVMP